MCLTKSWPICVSIIACSISFNAAAISPTLDLIKERGYIKCGVNQALPGFSRFNDDGSWSGLDVDVCRAIGAAIFHDDKHVRYSPLSAKDRFTALQSGEIDILSRNTTWTLTRDVGRGMIFTTVVFYDGQGFLVRKDSHYKNIEDLNNVTICCISGTTTELNVAEYFKQHNLKYKIITYEKENELISAYNSGRCDVYTGDSSALAAQRLRTNNPQDHVILPQTISKEPLAPAVRHDDAAWLDIVRWIIFGLFNAEEAGITKANVEEMLKSDDPTIQRLLGVHDDLGHYLGLSADFLYQIIKVTGNYGEIFERNVGKQSKLQLHRGLNNLWNEGGLMYGAPYR